MKIKFNITFSDQKGQPMEKYILNDTGQKSFMKKKNPLLQPTNVTEGKKQHNSTTNSANNIVNGNATVASNTGQGRNGSCNCCSRRQKFEDIEHLRSFMSFFMEKSTKK